MAQYVQSNQYALFHLAESLHFHPKYKDTLILCQGYEWYIPSFVLTFNSDMLLHYMNPRSGTPGIFNDYSDAMICLEDEKRVVDLSDLTSPVVVDMMVELFHTIKISMFGTIYERAGKPPQLCTKSPESLTGGVPFKSRSQSQSQSRDQSGYGLYLDLYWAGKRLQAEDLWVYAKEQFANLLRDWEHGKKTVDREDLQWVADRMDIRARIEGTNEQNDWELQRNWCAFRWFVHDGLAVAERNEKKEG